MKKLLNYSVLKFGFYYYFCLIENTDKDTDFKNVQNELCGTMLNLQIKSSKKSAAILKFTNDLIVNVEVHTSVGLDMRLSRSSFD